MELRVHFEDRDWTFDLDAMDVPQARAIKRQTGLSLLKFQEGLSEIDPDCVVAAYWLMKTQNGVVTDWNKVNFKVIDFTNALIEAGVEKIKEEEERAEGNPTPESAEAQPTT